MDRRRRITLPGGRAVEARAEVTSVVGGVVRSTHHDVFDDGERLLSTAALRFGTEEELRTSLEAAGFAVEGVEGGWRREPVGAGDGELLVVARR